ncbi:MAG TPA: AAA family ATPase [bacterium]|nr:AAA family ATPase [bacterium]
MYKREISVPKNNSYFLFGPRGTGKSTLIKQLYPDRESLYVDLLLFQTENQYARDPDLLYRQVKALSDEKKVVIIDEIQKIPKLLDVVHKLIEETDKRFILTGSSARKLKQGGVNLLAGRAFERTLHPLTSAELGKDFDLLQALQWGTLPGLGRQVNASDRMDFLQSYANTYLKEEIVSEQLIRKLDPFRKFLEVAAQHNGIIINFSNIAEDVGVDSKTVKSYFSILEDTLVGFVLEPYLQSTRKRVHQSPKFYFFDIGVCRALANLLTVVPAMSTAYYGTLFEHFVILEFIRREAYARKGFRFYYLSDERQEVDLIIERPGKALALIEIKSAIHIGERQVKKLRNFKSSFPSAEFYCLSQDPTTQSFDGIMAYHWQDGLNHLTQ